MSSYSAFKDQPDSGTLQAVEEKESTRMQDKYQESRAPQDQSCQEVSYAITAREPNAYSVSLAPRGQKLSDGWGLRSSTP